MLAHESCLPASSRSISGSTPVDERAGFPATSPIPVVPARARVRSGVWRHIGCWGRVATRHTRFSIKSLVASRFSRRPSRECHRLRACRGSVLAVPCATGGYGKRGATLRRRSQTGWPAPYTTREGGRQVRMQLSMTLSCRIHRAATISTRHITSSFVRKEITTMTIRSILLARIAPIAAAMSIFAAGPVFAESDGGGTPRESAPESAFTTLTNASHVLKYTYFKTVNDDFINLTTKIGR